MPNPSIDVLELAVAKRDTDAAFNEVLRILKSIDDRYGRVDMIEGAALNGDRRTERLATRFTAAFGQLICDPNCKLPPILFEQLAMHHRWIELMFSVSGFGSSDYLVPQLASGPPENRQVAPQDLARFLVLFSAASGMNMNLEECLRADAPSSVGAFMGYLGTRFSFTPNGHAFRERLLEWLPGRLHAVNLGALALQTLASPFMHCSYAMTPRKHDIKVDMIAQMRRGCLEAGAVEYDPAKPRAPAERPAVVITAENFSEGHSIHRTHSRAVKALRKQFKTVGVLYQNHVNPAIEACFDELIFYPNDLPFLAAVKKTADNILAKEPDMVLHLGVGMSPYVIALASLRLAPSQACSFGHTATTRSPVVDYMILPDDFIGDPGCFSEELVLVPPRAMPYEPRNDVDFAAIKQAAAAAKAQRKDGPVRIAIAASAMKLGPPFFDALAACVRASKTPIMFHAFPLGCSGLGYAELKRRLGERLPNNVIVNEEMPYGPYMEQLAACDFFICPFPYGNMNSIIDAVLVGLPGVCLDGPEAHAHADVAYFERMGFPKELAAASLDKYIAAIAKLADDPKWLAKCRKIASDVDLDKAFFIGEEALFTDAVAGLIERARNIGVQIKENAPLAAVS